MSYKKKNGYIRIIAIVITLVFVSALLVGIGSYLLGKVPNEKIVLQPNEEITAEHSSKTASSDNTLKYITVSQKGDIDISVKYLNPVIGSKDVLSFEVSLETHSIELTNYKDIRKYVEIRTDVGTVVSEGFEWDLKSSEIHHISGILKIKNIIDEKPIVGQDTKSFKLIFKNIPDGSEREHLYEGEKLR